MNIADKLKQLRTDKNMTQLQLANALGINQGMLSRWESGATAPSLKLRRLIADYFEMSVSEIFGNN
ncbi:MAG: helix-turn-helix transcriptional regulator [Oscillospiraceae bacterium]|nr:helix-turn-helix transcriptional regulator [Oscillospiraceae bacterium]